MLQFANFAADNVNLDFRCAGGSNVKCPTDAHMHSAFFTFTDDDHFTAEWSLMEKGKGDHKMKFEYVRKK